MKYTFESTCDTVTFSPFDYMQSSDLESRLDDIFDYVQNNFPNYYIYELGEEINVMESYVNDLPWTPEARERTILEESNVIASRFIEKLARN